MGGYLIVALGAGIGGALRHGVNVAAARLLGMGYPFGTITVNIVGSFVMGLLTRLFLAHPEISPSARLLLTTGVLGGFTTFSTFSLDAAVMIERNAWSTAAAYALASVAGSVAALFLGMWIGSGLDRG